MWISDPPLKISLLHFLGRIYTPNTWTQSRMQLSPNMYFSFFGDYIGMDRYGLSLFGVNVVVK